MKLLSVNVSLPKEIPYRRKKIKTGIFKEPVKGRVMLRILNLEGDKQADLRYHGGAYKAVYVYPFEHYEFWKGELGRNDITFGQFGENFTVVGMMEDEIHIGDVFRVGSSEVEVTQPRVPCYKLGIKMKSTKFLKQFLESGRVGFYLRVIKEGQVGAGDEIVRIKVDPVRMSVREISNLLFFDKDNSDGAKTALRIKGLSPGWHESFEKRLKDAGVSIKNS